MQTSQAAVPCAELMPAATRGFVSIPDIQTLQDHWEQTQLNKLIQDEQMRPFVEDMKQQIERKISGIRDKLGVELSDLREAAGGEIGLGMVELENEPAAVVVIIDTTGKGNQRSRLLKQIEQDLTDRGAEKQVTEIFNHSMTVYNVPPLGEEDTEHVAAYFVRDEMLCASDNIQVAKALLQQFDNESASLASVEAYRETMERCQNLSEFDPQLVAYVDPFGYARSVRSLNPNQVRRGKDYLKIFKSQGFDAIQGVGCYLNFAVNGSFEMLHRTAIFAPPIPGEPDKYLLAMRMMKFPNVQTLTAPAWLPRNLATYRTASLDLDHAFSYFDTLFDAIAGYEEAFAGVLEGLERDPYGPQVDVEHDFVAHLGERVLVITDYKVPITPKSERFMIAVEVTDMQAMQKTIEKFMKSDPNASKTEFEDKIIWEIHEAVHEAPEVDISVSELDLLEPVPAQGGGNNPQPDAPPSAVCLDNGYLLIASHSSFLKEVFQSKQNLNNANDYRAIDAALDDLLPGEFSAKCFLRTGQAYRPTYDLLRQNKMPQSETLMGRLLNRLLTPPEVSEEGILREQQIDGSKLPKFEAVRHYFGPAGTIIRSESDGWSVVGVSLTNIAPQANADANATAQDTSRR